MACTLDLEPVVRKPVQQRNNILSVGAEFGRRDTQLLGEQLSVWAAENRLDHSPLAFAQAVGDVELATVLSGLPPGPYGHSNGLTDGEACRADVAEHPAVSECSACMDVQVLCHVPEWILAKAAATGLSGAGGIATALQPVTVDGCGCTTCAGSVTSWVAEQVVAQGKCAGEVCCPLCDASLPHHEVLRFADAEVAARYERQTLEQCVSGIDGWVWCPKCPAGGFADHLLKGTTTCKAVECSACKFRFCLECRQDAAHHTGLAASISDGSVGGGSGSASTGEGMGAGGGGGTGADGSGSSGIWIETAQTLRWTGVWKSCQDAAVNQQEVLSIEWLAANSKACPSCHANIQHFSGCSHMTCRQCKHQFCWICLQKYSPGQYTFQLAGKCPCPKPPSG
jgi:hypothetical protein